MFAFDEDIALAAGEENQFMGIISDRWSVNGNPNGGYIMAIAAAAMMQTAEKKSTPIVTANYLSRCVPGPAEVQVSSMGRSNQFHRLEARLFQEGKEKVRLFGTFADAGNECTLERYETDAPVVAPHDDCVAMPPMPGYTLYHNLDVRLDPRCAGWAQGNLTDKSEHIGWISFKDGRALDLSSLFLIIDSFPPPAFATQGLTAWVPTIELSVNIRNLPQGNRLKCALRTRFITCGLLEEDGELWDESGKLVAISRQIAQYRKLG